MARYEGALAAHPDDRFCVVVSRFNRQVTALLEEGAVDRLVRSGVAPDQIDVVAVPGALELAPAVARLERGGYAAIICLGAVVRGETPHFDYVAANTSARLVELSVKGPAPVVFGVITTDTMEQARDRAGGKAGNKGADAAQTALEMASLWRQLDAAGHPAEEASE
jgi:6,7-dimethyl-8-ribityllumazine synthase